MTITEQANLVGTYHTLDNGDGLRVTVKITDVKSAYGQLRAVVTPDAGFGFATVSIDRLMAIPR